jgi:hypothetical protein
MRVAIANFSTPIQKSRDFRSYWAGHVMPEKRPRRESLFEQKPDWGFHIYSIGVYMLDAGLADDVEFWDYSERWPTEYHSNGILRVMFLNDEDVKAYLERYGYPDLFINHGSAHCGILHHLAGKCFRVHVPALKPQLDGRENDGAECYLVDSEEQLDDRSMMYIPVVNTKRIYLVDVEKERDFIYLAGAYRGKRHDILLDAVRGTELTGHLHPVDKSTLDLTNTRITTSNWNERDVVEVLRTSRMAVYPGDATSSPAAMWECVAAGLPIVVNENIAGGKHLVVPGVTGEFATEETFRDVMKHVLDNLASYRPRQYFEDHWDTVATIESYLSFFSKMGWKA